MSPAIKTLKVGIKNLQQNSFGMWQLPRDLGVPGLQFVLFAGVTLCRTTTTARTSTGSSTMSPSFIARPVAPYFLLRWPLSKFIVQYWQIIVKGDLVHLVAGGPLHQPGRGCRWLLLPSHWNHIKDAQVWFQKYFPLFYITWVTIMALFYFQNLKFEVLF